MLRKKSTRILRWSLPASARVSRVGFGVPPKQSLKFAMARRHRQHARRVRYPSVLALEKIIGERVQRFGLSVEDRQCVVRPTGEPFGFEA